MVVNAILLWVDNIDMWNVQCDNAYEDQCASGSIVFFAYESPSKAVVDLVKEKDSILLENFRLIL